LIGFDLSLKTFLFGDFHLKNDYLNKNKKQKVNIPILMHIYFILIKYFSKRTKKNEKKIKSHKRQHKTMFSYTQHNTKPIHRSLTSQKKENKHRISYYIIITDSLYLLLFNIRIN